MDDQGETPAALGFRMPAEWEPHAATWLAWPHKEASWPGNFEPIPAIWAEMKTRAEQLQPLLLPQSSLGKAIRYLLSEHAALQIYLERPDYQIDNNLIENSIRPSCVGKRRWLFIGHPQAGWRSAVIYSIIQSCRRRGIDPQEYLTDVLGRLPGMKNTQIDSLLPENWQAARAKAAAIPGSPPAT